ncbi:MAG TPA: hypothetical protein EYG58_01765, partial [Nitrospirales bacterium]|nr:hypothetical protein [Nitrospirales bacterium]HIC04676.1 hypothetical protein [Nitrospirales bacterium]HIN34092.1 hypothetical protein [Nitrospirales bacterium]HIO69258.1 hypothetical protein [Nitrospirales bacterium]
MVSCMVILFTGIVYGAEVDKDTGLLIAEHWETVRNNCTECHSAKLVTAQRGDRKTWTDIIRWMQATQGLWDFDAETENQILQYLSSNYAPQARGRRGPIPLLLMPPNP